MPLQKQQQPFSPQAGDGQTTKRRQLQERRRTLQTISELSPTDEDSSDFASFIRTEQSRRVNFAPPQSISNKTSQFVKRQSLPQYRTTSQGADVPHQAVMISENAPDNSASLRLSESSRTTTLEAREDGWNARREKDRATMLQEHAIVHAIAQRQASKSQLRIGIGSQPNLPSTSPLPNMPGPKFTPGKQHSHHNLVSYSSQQQLLRNSRSINGFTSAPGTGTKPLRTSIGRNAYHTHGMYGHSDQETNTESSGRASTDSSSYRSSHDSGLRSSRSGASSRSSATLHGSSPPPIPKPVLVSRSLRDKSCYYGKSGTTQAYTPSPVCVRSTDHQHRSWSLPAIRVQDMSNLSPGAKPTHLREHEPGQHQQWTRNVHIDTDVQKARMETLAALTSTNNNSHPPLPSNAMQMYNQSYSKQHPHRSSTSSNKTRPRSSSSLKVPNAGPQTPVPKLPRPSSTSPSPPQTLDPRPIPKRESLTQWKAERDSASHVHPRVRPGSDHKRGPQHPFPHPLSPGGTEKTPAYGSTKPKLDVKERVRRANELEAERERELVKAGKGVGYPVGGPEHMRWSIDEKGYEKGVRKIRQWDKGHKNDDALEKEQVVEKNEKASRGCLDPVWKVLGWGGV